MKKKIGIGIVVLLVIMQFFRIDKSVPEHNSNDDILVMNPASEHVGQLVKAACYDCHSYETKYPWYTNVAPLSFWIKGHIKAGRQKLNFAEWASYSEDKRNHKLEESIEEMMDNHMPLKSYTWLHPEAKLGDKDKKDIAEWMKSQIK